MDMDPAEEDVACGLHEALADDDALAMIAKLARSQELLEHRRLRLLHLQEQGVLPVAPEQQPDPRPRTDAADAHDLAREVDELELLEQHAPVVLERRTVGTQEPVQLVAQV